MPYSPMQLTPPDFIISTGTTLARNTLSFVWRRHTCSSHRQASLTQNLKCPNLPEPSPRPCTCATQTPAALLPSPHPLVFWQPAKGPPGAAAATLALIETPRRCSPRLRSSYRWLRPFQRSGPTQDCRDIILGLGLQKKVAEKSRHCLVASLRWPPKFMTRSFENARFRRRSLQVVASAGYASSSPFFE
jgi:hypothetical protein